MIAGLHGASYIQSRGAGCQKMLWLPGQEKIFLLTAPFHRTLYVHRIRKFSYVIIIGQSTQDKEKPAILYGRLFFIAIQI